jgi:hypothetical protein
MFELKLNGVAVGLAMVDVTCFTKVIGAGGTAIPDSTFEIVAT